jgi:hypothetical protein
MKLYKIVLGAVGLALISTQAFAQTQTPASAATPNNTKKVDVGTSASFLKFVAVGNCVVDPGSIAAGASMLHTCSVPGAVAGDFVALTMRPGIDADRCLVVQSAFISAANTLTFRLLDNITVTTACDPAATTFDYLVVRANPQGN